MNKSHCFSTKRGADQAFIEGFKQLALVNGHSFSYLVIKAIKEYAENHQVKAKIDEIISDIHGEVK